MDQKAVVDAIEKQMDALESIFNWIVLFTIPVFWAGLQRRNELEVLGMTINLSQAFYILVIAYFMTSVQVYLGLLRIANFLNLLDQENSPSGISKLLLHRWIFNPFIYTGDDKWSRLHILFGSGGMVAAWAISAAALATLGQFLPEWTGNLVLGLLIFTGLTTIPAARDVVLTILAKMHQTESELFEKYAVTLRTRQRGTFVGLGLGMLIHLAIRFGDAWFH